VRFFRICKAAQGTARAAFSGLGATKQDGRWTHGRPNVRAVYCSESLPLACLETLVHIRPMPRRFPPSIFYSIDIPDELLERPAHSALPAGWNDPVAPAAARDFGSAFVTESRAVALVVPTAILPLGLNALVNPLHPAFRLAWVRGPQPFVYDGRLK